MHNLQNKNEPNGSLLGEDSVALEGCGQVNLKKPTIQHFSLLRGPSLQREIGGLGL